MLTVACVEWGNYQGRGEDYVERLRAGVARHLNAAHRFECIRPEGGLRGWWNKIELFRPGRFSGRVLYFDLDTLIVGPIDPLAEYEGILHLADWGWKQNDYGSGVMVWNAGEHAAIWTQYNDEVPRDFRGDQDWIKTVSVWAALPKGLCVSYRYHCKAGIPASASVVCFHGKDKPHNAAADWVAEHWRV